MQGKGSHFKNVQILFTVLSVNDLKIIQYDKAENNIL
jgi:hypothetical protein